MRSQAARERLRPGKPDFHTLLLRNTGEFIKKRLALVYALEFPHDAVQRSSENCGYGGAGLRVAFPNPAQSSAEHIYGAAQSRYNETYLKNGRVDCVALSRNIHFYYRDTKGETVGNRVSMLQPSHRSDADLQETLIHEVQHAVEKPDLSASSRYRSEYRAYWLGKRPYPRGAKFPTTRRIAGVIGGEVVEGWQSPKHYQIFKHVYDNYEYVKEEWDRERSKPVTERRFRNLVLSYHRPFGLNLINSARLDGLIKALADGALKSAVFIRAVLALDDHDIESIHRDRGLDELMRRKRALIRRFIQSLSEFGAGKTITAIGVDNYGKFVRNLQRIYIGRI